MHNLLQAIADLSLELHPERIATVASKIESLESVEQFSLSRASFGPNTNKELVDRLYIAWLNNRNTSPLEVASALRGASAVIMQEINRGSVELVWTGPSTGQFPIRHTEQVLCELIETAKKQLFLVSFVAYEVSSIIKALTQAIERQVQINILLESSDKHGGRVTHDSVSRMKDFLPSANVFTWAADKKLQRGQLKGAIHAKCAVADGDTAFITSANLTTAAMECNFELGTLVKGGHLPLLLHQHLETLITAKIIKNVNEDSTVQDNPA